VDSCYCMSHVRVGTDSSFVPHTVGGVVVSGEESPGRTGELVFRFVGGNNHASKVDSGCNIFEPVDVCILVAAFVEHLFDLRDHNRAQLLPGYMPLKKQIRQVPSHAQVGTGILVCNPVRVAFDNVAERMSPFGTSTIFVVSSDDAPQPLAFMIDVAGDPGLFLALPEDASKFALQANDCSVFLACRSCEPRDDNKARFEALQDLGLHRNTLMNKEDFMGIMAEAEFFQLLATLDTHGTGYLKAKDFDHILCGMRDLISDDRKSLIDVKDGDMHVDYEQFSRLLLGTTLK
jgi:hypothetical protein